MTIQPAGAYAPTPLLTGSTQPLRAHAAASTATAAANPADRVTISRAARDLFAAQSGSAAATTGGATARYDTSKGSLDMDIDTYFTPGANGGGAAHSLQSLPPLLLPTQKNVDALRHHISAAMPGFLSRNGIPSAPASISYDTAGKMQLPADYAYADQFRAALAQDPALERELSTVNALASHVAELNKLIPFQKEMAAATSQSAADAIVAKYSYLFSGNHHYDSIALAFSPNGELSVTADGKLMA